jgi:hypothetical protein
MLGFCDGCGGKERLVSAFECRNYCTTCHPCFGIDAMLVGLVRRLLETELPHHSVRGNLSLAEKAFDRGDFEAGVQSLRAAFVDAVLADAFGVAASVMFVFNMAGSVKGLR